MSDETDTSLLPCLCPAVSLMTFFNQGQTLMYPFTFNQPNPSPSSSSSLNTSFLPAFPLANPPLLCNLKIYGSYRHCDSALMYCVYVTGHRPLPTAAVPTVPSDCAVGPSPPACQQLRTVSNLIKIFIYTAINNPGLSAM